MGYIYCIQNIINNKLYIGQTTKTLEEQFKMHIHDSQVNKRCQQREFYKDILYYGANKFSISILEKIDDNKKLNQRERYWINKYLQINKELYNISLGGAGKLLFNKNKIIKLYNKGIKPKYITRLMGCCYETVLNVLNNNNINLNKYRHIVLQYDLNNKYLQTFNGTTEAAKWLVDNKYSKSKKCNTHITECCNGKISKAYGFKWKYKV